jgi:hypothetical protein
LVDVDDDEEVEEELLLAQPIAMAPADKSSARRPGMQVWRAGAIAAMRGAFIGFPPEWFALL